MHDGRHANYTWQNPDNWNSVNLELFFSWILPHKILYVYTLYGCHDLDNFLVASDNCL